MNIIFHDVDGCLNVDAETPIPVGGECLSQNQIAKLGELGHKLDDSSIDHFVINTGRSIKETLPIVESITSRKLQYVIAEHGAVCLDVKSNKYVVPQTQIAVKLELIRSFIEWYRESGFKSLNKRVGTAVPILDKAANLTLDARSKVDSQRVYDELIALVKNDSPFDHNELVFHHSKADGFVDAMSLVDKGDGVEEITSLLSKAKSSTTPICTIAIGNGLNDMPMLRIVTIPVCPENAEYEVKDYCRSRSGVVSKYGFIDATLQWLDAYI